MRRSVPRHGTIAPLRGSQRPAWPFALNRHSRQAEGLILWCPMLPLGGDKLLDLSGNGRHGTLSGASFGVGNAQAGQEGTVIVHDSTADRVNWSNTESWLPTGPAITIALWYRKRDATLRPSGAFGVAGDGSNRCGVHLPWDDGIVYWDYGSNRLTASGLSFAADHWAFVVNGNGMAIYQNGILVASNATVATRNSMVGQTFALGVHPAGTPSDLADYGEFRVYNRGFTAAEVRQLLDPPTRWELYDPVRHRLWALGSPFVPRLLAVPGSVGTAPAASGRSGTQISIPGSV